jgi:hypothetical protein
MAGQVTETTGEVAYKEHRYKINRRFATVAGGGSKYLTGIETYVDGQLLTRRTPGFVPSEKNPVQAAKDYIDHLESPQD